MYKRQIETVLTLDARTPFRGVYPMDRLPEQRKSGAYVINTDNHDQPGSHWVAVYDDGKVEYMDSYGLPPTDPRCLKFLGQHFSYNTIGVQQLYSNACGFYCVYFLLQRARGHSADVIMSMLSRTDSDFIVKSFIYSRYKPVFI